MNRYEILLRDRCAIDPRIMVLTAENRGHMRSVPPLLGDRFVDVGIAEQTMIGMAAGLAARGRVVVVHALAAFLTLRAFEFIRDDVAIPNLPVIMVGMVPGVLSDGNGPTHQAIDDVGLMRAMPNIGVFCPADEEEFVEGMAELFDNPRPCYVRYIGSQSAYRREQRTTLQRGIVLSDERECCPDVALLTYGAMVPHVLEAVQQLEQTGVSVRVVHLPMIDPLDESIIVEALHDAAVTVVVEDHLIRSGLYSVVCEIAVRNRIHASVHPIGLPSWFAAGRLPQVLRVNGLNGESIAQRVTAILNDEATMQRTTNGESHAS
jgi:transketolase